MFFSKVVGIAALFMTVGVRAADYYINPETVPITTRDKWCNDQTSTCPLLCLQYPEASMTTDSNQCDPEALTYECVCGNGQSPNMTEYSLTLPFHICQEWGVQCVAGCGNNNNCQAACTQDHPCGAQNPTHVNATSTASDSAATATGTGGASNAKETQVVAHTGFGSDNSGTTTETGAAASTPTSAAQAALNLGGSYGLPVVFAGIFAVFGFAM